MHHESTLMIFLNRQPRLNYKKFRKESPCAVSSALRTQHFRWQPNEILLVCRHNDVLNAAGDLGILKFLHKGHALARVPLDE